MIGKVLTKPTAEFFDVLKRISHESPSETVRDLAAKLCGNTGAMEMNSGFRTHLNKMMTFLDNPLYANMVCNSTFNAKELLDGKTTIFLHIPKRTLLNNATAARILIGYFMHVVERGKLDPEKSRVLFAIDEAALVSIDDLVLALTTGRSAGIVLRSLYQNVAQLRDQWGKEKASAWFANCGWISLARINDYDEAMGLERRLGTFGVEAESQGRNRGSSGGMLGNSSRSSGSNVNVHEIKTPLLYARQIEELKAGRQITFVQGEQPIMCDRPACYELPQVMALIDNMESKDVGEDDGRTAGGDSVGAVAAQNSRGAGLRVLAGGKSED
jgi:type IV secretion system protein VirD4